MHHIVRMNYDELYGYKRKVTVTNHGFAHYVLILKLYLKLKTVVSKSCNSMFVGGHLPASKLKNSKHYTYNTGIIIDEIYLPFLVS